MLICFSFDLHLLIGFLMNYSYILDVWWTNYVAMWAILKTGNFCSWVLEGIHCSGMKWDKRDGTVVLAAFLDL